ncbi:MAG: OmcA/MtrC family decaheme c-type cytochrome [Candidatus Omnitrophica bacterium]|nr:OmcA/MtrC family decaheme c-type cytochrome [Candidatus Omnitrophota bacterium]
MRKSIFLAPFIVLLLFSSGLYAAEGLNVTIENVTINDALQPVVTFTMYDDSGMPIGIDEVSYRFVFARLEVIDADKNTTRYANYITQIQTVPEGYENAGAQAVQGSYDQRGEIADLGAGRYMYTFENSLTDDIDMTLTHTMSGQIQRSVGENEYIANPLYHYVPDGSEVTQLRKVVTTDGCNQCHTNLAIHGGGRREIGYCILCHNPQSTDPDTGNSVDMTEMIHKIHMGANLPSVEAGGSYKIIGYRQSVHDYSHVEFPQDMRNCLVCHNGPDADLYKTAPSRSACGSCHDNVNFSTGEGHGPGLPQADDNSCSMCHAAEGDEFGLSIVGAHTIPNKSKSLKGLNAEILEVVDAAPGSFPTVKFKLVENDGAPVDISTLGRLRVLYSGPSKEYKDYTQEDMLSDPTSIVPEGEVLTYTFDSPLPIDAEGTYAFVIETRRDVIVYDNPGEEDDITGRETAFNPVKFVAVTGENIVERRHVVDQDKCHVCHGSLSFHGDQRTNVDYCVVCHNPYGSDIEERPEGVSGGESISFAYMIHKIHTGEELNQDYIVYGHNSSEYKFHEILFPGDRTQCMICHIEDVPSLPISSDAEAVFFMDKESNMVTIPPMTAACTSCHDSEEALAHAELNTTQSGKESCSVCHREDRNADIIEAHKNTSFLNVIEVSGTPSTTVDEWDLH